MHSIIERWKWADPTSRSAYFAQRADKKALVTRSIAAAQFMGITSGSWSRGDFHLAPDGRSESDLDLVFPGASEKERRNAQERVAESLSLQLFLLKVSVHPSDSFAAMSLREQFYFNVMELLSATKSSNLNYHAAKAALMLSRVDPAETAVEAGMRRGLQSALSVKIGVSSELDRESTADAISHIEVGGLAIGDWLAMPETGLMRLAEHFDQRASESGEWIYSHAAHKARTAENRVRHST